MTNSTLLHFFIMSTGSQPSRAPLFRYSSAKFAAEARLTNILKNIQPTPPTPRTAALRALIRERLPQIKMEHELTTLARQFEHYEGPSDWDSLESPPPPASPSTDPILEGNQQKYFGTEEPTEEEEVTEEQLEDLCEDCPWLEDDYCYMEQDVTTPPPNEYDLIDDQEDVRRQSIDYLLNQYPLHQHPGYSP